MDVTDSRQANTDNFKRRLGFRKEGLEFPQGFNSASQHLVQNGQNGLPLKGLSPSKDYIEGRLIICVLLKSRAGAKANRVTCNDLPSRGTSAKSYSANCDTILRFDVTDVDVLFGWQEGDVLIGDVQNMDGQEIAPVPSRIGLYDVEDMIDHGLAWSDSQFCMSVDGTFKVLPSSLVRKGKLDSARITMIDNIASVGLDQDTVCVVQGSPEVVQRVANDRGRMRRQRGADWRSGLPNLSVTLGPESVFISHNVSVEDTFEVVDMVFGPFGL